MILRVGMLWFDDSADRPLEAKIERAARRYREKYGRAPNVCYVHISAFKPEASTEALKVIGRADILPHHLWLGEV
ncbi:MAG: hypothetical protein H5T70_10270 [Chloroflexi bacterium]|nr:hypothetical protein [Chloroflexota bacterium]MBC7316792.1 hypothetical protein [Chloroflexota bacterium]